MHPLIFVSALANELRVFRQIRHPNIVSFIGACIDPDSFDIVLFFEPVDGVRLDAYLSKHVSAFRSELQGLAILLGMSSALSHLHSSNPSVVHGDLKPSNILIEGEHNRPRPKLLDFGISCMLTRTAGPLRGTRGWMAPELVSPTTRPAPSVDVFSYGLLVRFVCAGTSPFVSSAAGVGGTDGATASDEHPAQSCNVITTCHQIWLACTVMDPLQRPRMDKVQEQLLMAVPKDCWEKLGQSALMLASPGLELQRGRDEIEEMCKNMRMVPLHKGGRLPCASGQIDARRRLAL